MKNNATVDADKRLEVLLAGLPLEPSGDFSRRVCEACLEEVLDAKLAQMPVEPSSGFSDRVMSEIRSQNNVVVFPRRFSAFRRGLRISVAGIAAALAVCAGLFSLNRRAIPLNEQIASAINADPELVRLATADDDDFTFSELVAASQLLTVLNDNSSQTADFFAYYEN